MTIDVDNASSEALHDFVEDIRRRVVEADTLRENGQLADGVEPSDAELDQAVAALRRIRELRAKPKAKKADKPALTLADLTK